MAAGGFIDIWINCPDAAVAERIASAAVEGRLAACANILPPISSIYRWNGAIGRAEEVTLVLKSRRDLFEPLATLAKRLHPYEVPSIIATELALVEDDYAQWLQNETRDLR